MIVLRRVMREYLAQILSGLTLAGILWVGHGLSDLGATIKVHEWRLQALESART